MSLINEALKKAQKQRAEEEAVRSGKVAAPGTLYSPGGTQPPELPPPAAPPAAASEPEPDPVSQRSDLQDSRRGSSNGLSLKWIGVTAGVLASESSGNELGAADTRPLEIDVAARGLPSVVEQNQPSSPDSQSSADNDTDSKPASDSNLPVDESVGTQKIVGNPAAGEVVILTDDVPPPVQVEASTDSGTVADGAILTFLETARVTGVRASNTDPKVLMNNRVYRLNDLISRDLQLRVTLIESRKLQFTDARGYVYTKEF